MTQRRIEVVTSAEPPTCPRCGGEGLLLARVPHGWVNASGARVEGRTGVVLCAGCDADAPHAAPLITWFQVHGNVEADTSDEFARLLTVWAEHVSVAPLDTDGLNAEVEQFRRGDL
ncbi:DUF6300 family protein [Nonomuraea sp. NPDC052265]|uniref:DUF6300 family protein n=1 Tax=Nonomuraea sp. NPDC052265 TaxID=3364374 RepID=UPI0037C885A1